MILRASDRALADHLARIDIRVSALWRELDAVQLHLAEDRGDHHALTTREREILAELDRIDS